MVINYKPRANEWWRMGVATLTNIPLLIYSFFNSSKGLKHFTYCHANDWFSIPQTFKFMSGGPILLHLHLKFTALSITNDKMWTSIHRSPKLSWSSRWPNNITITQDILGNHYSMLDQCPWKSCRSALDGFGRLCHLTHRNLLDNWDNHYPTVKKYFVSLPIFGTKYIFCFGRWGW